MPRTYVKGSTGRMCHKYSPEALEEAMEAVKSGRKSINKAAKDFKIPKGTLVNKLKGKYGDKMGRPCVLNEHEEKVLVNRLILCAQYGFPLTRMDLRIVIKTYLDSTGRDVSQFKSNLPGLDWLRSFLKRHSTSLTERIANNIKRARAEVSEEMLREYHTDLQKELKDIPPSNIFNYDETNLTDSPGKKKHVFVKGAKHCDNIMNTTKSAISLMFCCAADGTLLPPFVVYKALNMYQSWTTNGHRGKPCCNEVCCKGGVNYSCTASGWFDHISFSQWFKTVVIPHAGKLSGPKALIGDNLRSHFSYEVLALCEQHNIKFICLPPNATHLAQPLDVAVFRPLKQAWSDVVTKFKINHPTGSCTNKILFPGLLKQLLLHPIINDNVHSSIKSGFRATGIYPLSIDPLLKRLTGKKRKVVGQEM